MFGRKRADELLRSAEMAGFFAVLDRLTAGQMQALRFFWHAIPRAEHEKAWAAVREAAARDGLTDAIGGVRQAALDWTARGSNRPGGRGQPDYRSWIELKIGASEGIVDAALATALGSRLGDGAAVEILLTPWRKTIAGERPDWDSQEDSEPD